MTPKDRESAYTNYLSYNRIGQLADMRYVTCIIPVIPGQKTYPCSL